MKNKAIVSLEIGDWFCFRKSLPIYEATETLNLKMIRVTKSQRFKHENEVSVLSDMTSMQQLAQELLALDYEIIEVVSTSDFLFIQSIELKKILGLVEKENSLMNVSDKDRLFKLLQKNNLPSLKQEAPLKEADLKIFEDHKIILKPALSTGGVKRKPWDYQVFNNIYEISSDVKNQIFEQNLNEPRKTIVQTFIADPMCLDIHFVLDGHSKSHIFLEAVTNTNRKENSFMILESWGGVTLPEVIREKINQHLKLIEQLKLKNMILNAQFVVSKNTIYLIDLNLRCAGVWAVLYKHMMPDFFVQYLQMLLRKEFKFSFAKKFYLKCPIYLKVGKTVKNIVWPSTEFSEELLYKENVKLGEIVGEDINSIQPSPQVFFVADSMAVCVEKGKKFFQALKVDYE